MRVKTPDDIGIIARQRRQELGLSQTELAERCGVTRQWLTRFESGNSEVSLSKALAVLRELELAIRIDTPSQSPTIVVPAIPFKIPRIAMPKMTLPTIRIPDSVLAKLNE